MIVCLYRAGPLEDLANIAEVRDMALTGDRVTAVFAGIPFHEYAVFVLHDENKNRVPDTGPDNIPVEGMGMSEITMTPQEKPDFDSSKFNFNRKSLELHIPVIYMESSL